MMDIGSALLSAETALNCWLPRSPQKYVCVLRRWSRYTGSNGQRGLGGGDRQSYLDAMHALEAKREQLGLPSSNTKSLTHVLRTMKKPVLWRWS